MCPESTLRSPNTPASLPSSRSVSPGCLRGFGVLLVVVGGGCVVLPACVASHHHPFSVCSTGNCVSLSLDPLILARPAPSACRIETLRPANIFLKIPKYGTGLLFPYSSLCFGCLWFKKERVLAADCLVMRRKSNIRPCFLCSWICLVLWGCVWPNGD